MKFGIAIYSNIEHDKTQLIVKFSDSINDYIQGKKYGNSIKLFTIGVICVTKEFEAFFKPKKPKYQKGKKTITYDSSSVVIEDSFSYDIVLDFETFNNSKDSVSLKLLANAILDTVLIVDEFKKKITDFDSVQFRKDLETYFRINKLI